MQPGITSEQLVQKKKTEILTSLAIGESLIALTIFCARPSKFTFPWSWLRRGLSQWTKVHVPRCFIRLHQTSAEFIRLHQTSQTFDIPTSEIDSSEEFLRLRGALSTLGGCLTHHASVICHLSEPIEPIKTDTTARPKRTWWLAFLASPANFRNV